MIAEGRYQFKEVIEYLSRRGVRITKTSFRHVFTNRFYAGFVTGKLVEGKLIKGHHPPLVDIKTFMTVQDILNENPIVGVPKISRHNEVPLKPFAKDEASGIPFTGYKTKGIWYYKIKEGPRPVNVNAKHLNGLFVNLLSNYQYNPALRKQLQSTLTQKLKERLALSEKESTLIKKKLAEKKSLLEKLELKFIADQITEELYQKHATTLRQEIDQFSKEIESTSFSSSNLENAVSKCMTIAQNLCQSCATAEYETKQELQKLVFP